LTSAGAGPEPSRDDPAALLGEFRATLPRDLRGATRLAVRVIRAARAREDGLHELRGYWAMSSAAALGRRPRAVLAIIERALACDAAKGDEALRARTTLGRGSALIHFGRLDDVRREVGEALPALRRAGDRQGQATAHGLLAQVAIEEGRHAEAIEHLQAKSAALGDGASPLALAAIEETEANCRVGLFDFAEALRLFESACARFEAMGTTLEAVNARFNSAYLHLKSGRYADALRLYAQVAEAFERAPSDLLLRTLCVDRAELLLEIGAVAEARRWTARALAAADGNLSVKDELRSKHLLAAAALLDGDADAAMAAASAVAEGFERLSNPCGVAESLIVCSAAALARGRAAEALRFADDAVAHFAKAGAGVAAGGADFAACRAALAAGDVSRGTAALDRAASRSGVDVLPWASIELDRHRAMVSRARGEHVAAAELLDRAVRELDARRGLLPPDALRSAFLSLHAPLHREAVDANVRVGRDERAFELAAASKSRALLDMISGGSQVDAADAPRFDSLRSDLGAVYARLHEMSLRPTADADLEAARSQALRVEREMAELASESFNRGEGEAAPRPGRPIADPRAGLATDEALIEYAFGEDRLRAFVVMRDGVRRVDLPATSAEIVRGVRKFSFHLASAMAEQEAAGAPESLDAARANLDALRKRLIDPLELPKSVRRVVVAPDRELHGVAFHAMPSGDSWWADEVLVTYAPSALVHAACLRERVGASGPPHVLASPDDAVPEIETETRVVAEALGPRTVVRTGDAATWAAFERSAGEAGLLHVATHGMSRADSVVGGSVRLADGWLTQFDLYRVRVRADLVVLSACDSGATRHEASGDPFGLVRGFLCAGARALVASRWRVDDRTTALWMGAFYGALSSGRRVGDAYLAACADVRSSNPHPFHWAAFTLTGDAGRSFSF
jgi:tetratricopeptide (TPR) repeat protein